MTGPDEIRRLIEQLQERAIYRCAGVVTPVYAYERAIADVLALLPSASPQAEREGFDCEMALRRELWLGHGHQGVYGDDGEMQCGQCAPMFWDYKRTPIERLVRHVGEVRLRAAAIASAHPPAKEG